MITEIYKFEIQYRLKRPETYIFFLFIFLFALGGVEFIFEGKSLGLVKKNAPIVVAKTMAAITGILMMIVSLVMGTAVLRDFKFDFQALMFVNPINKKDYLLGKFLGSFTVLLFIFSGLLWGMILGEYMPWRHPDDLLPFQLKTYIYTFLTIVLPGLFFGSILFFVTGALSRSMMVIYTQGIFLFVVFMLTKAISNEYLQAVLDPFSLTTTSRMVDLWTPEEKNVRLIPFSGVLLVNIIFWLAVGFLTGWIGYKKFDLVLNHRKKVKNKKEEVLTNDDDNFVFRKPEITLGTHFSDRVTQLFHLSWFYFTSIFKQVSFLAILVCGGIIIMINSINLGTVHGVDSFPKTYFIIAELQEMSLYFFLIILVFYAGEIIWKERDVKFYLIFAATPIPDFTHVFAKFLGLSLIYLTLLVSLIFYGVSFQTLSGFYEYDWLVYAGGFFLELFPFLLLFSIIAFFFQVMTNRKYVGFILTLAFFVATILVQALGVDHDLFLFGGKTLPSYSDMNGYGEVLSYFLLVKFYWLIFGMLLLIICSILMTRGTETTLKKRWDFIAQRFTPSLKKMTVILSMIFIGTASFIFYQTNIENEYWSLNRKQTFRADYEKTLSKWEYLPQPKIADVKLNLDLFPNKKQYFLTGEFLLTNKTESPIKEIHLQKLLDDQVKLENIIFNTPITINNSYEKFGYTIYNLKKPLTKGDTLKMNFTQTYKAKPFSGEKPRKGLNKNGTFLTNDDFPTFGYNRKYELEDPRTRAAYDLPAEKIILPENQKIEETRGRSISDADLINFSITTSTSTDQQVIAPGTLEKKWTTNNRNYFAYKMEIPMINFYSILSGKYQVQKDEWLFKTDSTRTNLEIYYHQGHEYNLGRMMASMKASLNYYSRHFSPYQYNHLRIVEFPRFADFAQSFPGTIPFSESIGFVLDINDEKDVDMVFYITAHETAHQWWGMQIEAANVPGRNMILESLAQYSALMVMKENFPDHKIQQFLDLQLENYLEKRNKATKEEPPLAQVEKQDYIYYEKGAINFYAFQESIGTKNVNRALRQFILDWNNQNGILKKQTDRYPKTDDLLGYFREVTPDSLQYLITELFE